MRRNYEPDDEASPADAYTAQGYKGVAWSVMGWETEPDEDTEWSGCEVRTGRVVAIGVRHRVKRRHSRAKASRFGEVSRK